MKTISKLAIATLLLCPALGLAAVPGTVAFTARIADGGAPVNATNVAFTFTLFDALTAGNSVWNEGKALDVTDGVVTTALGDTIPLPAFTGTPLFLEVAMSGTAFSPRIAIQSVPYALRAAEADHATNADTATSATNASAVPWTGVTGTPTFSCTTETGATATTVAAGATASGDIDCTTGIAVAPFLSSASSSDLWMTGSAPGYSVRICIGLLCRWYPHNGCRVTMSNSGLASQTFTPGCRCCTY